MKRKAIGSVLVIAALAPNSPALSPQKKTQKKGQQSAVALRGSTASKRLAVEKKARELIADELGLKLEEVKPQARFIDDLGADSLDTVELVMRFEEVFDIEIPDRDCEKIQTVQHAYDYLVAHVPVWPKEKPRKP